MSDRALQRNAKADSKRKYFALPDLFLAGVIAILAVLSFFLVFRSSDDAQLVAVIKVGGAVYTEIPLSQVEESYTLTVKGYEGEDVQLSIAPDSVEFISSPCRDKLCVNSGKLSKCGDSAVCLPQRVSVQLLSVDDDKNQNQPDAVAG